MSRSAFKLVDSVGAFGTPAFAAVLRGELLALPEGVLPIAGEQGGLIDPASLGLTLLSSRADVERIEVAVGVFFTEIVGGCSCGDEPLSVNGYMELSLRIERTDGAAVILLRGD
ncbi:MULTISPECIES: glucosamine--fructose-6-phosphate aminotransferase [unclassified Thiocapsa]|uniref:glucosamine--fructose-6-phosphate aminotransferase n=1 Tax=unclassified Thiocapsa TaxID=2641286 RepID=UPI0035AFC5D9